MAKARAIVKRRRAVQNIRKVTRTMQLVATARFQQAHSRVAAGQPYVRAIRDLVAQLSGAEGLAFDHPLMRAHADAPADLVVVLTSNRGLCGGYNASILRTAIGHMQRLDHERRTTLTHVIGKKGMSYFRFLGRPVERVHAQFGDRPTYEQVAVFAGDLMARYAAGELRNVWVAYMHFVSTGSQRAEVMRLLPIEAPPRGGGVHEHPRQWEFAPDPASLLAELLPESVRVSLYQCFLEAMVSEQVARMVAMKSATDAAGDMIRFLSLRYNRARQSQITLELLDIVGGASALE